MGVGWGFGVGYKLMGLSPLSRLGKWGRNPCRGEGGRVRSENLGAHR